MAGLIVEGPDGVGKTELIRKIQHQTFHPVVHLVQPGTPDIRQMFRLLRAGPIIFDRFHLSPVVYGEVLRQGSELDKHDMWALEGLLVALGYRMVICLAPTEVAVENNRRKKQLWEEVRDEQMVDALSEGYRREFDRTQLEVMCYDYTRNDHGERMVDWALEDRPVAPLGVLGSPKPKRWLVGDQRNGFDVDFDAVPFYWPSMGHKLLAGTVVSRSMEALGWSWQDTAVSNSDVIDLARTWFDLGCPKSTIALGSEAAVKLDNALPAECARFVKVPHPQWWRRFHHHDLLGYIEMLEKADVA